MKIFDFLKCKHDFKLVSSTTHYKWNGLRYSGQTIVKVFKCEKCGETKTDTDIYQY